MNQLIDRFGRKHRSLRISVTDRCNIRCQYCMSDGPLEFLPKKQLLTYEEIASFCQLMTRFGITRLRLTGGEPLVRGELSTLVRLLRQIPAVESIAMTTNGMLLDQHLETLKDAGLDQINISLDTLSETTFRKLSRRDGIERVLAGIDAAIAHGYRPRLNTVLLRDLNFEDAIGLVEFAIERGLVVRFIEFMPLDSDRQWNGSQMVSGEELRTHLATRFGPMIPIDRKDLSRPARDYRFEGLSGSVGFIDSVSKPFCAACDRLRLTADGKLRNCLFGNDEWNIGEVLRTQDGENELIRLIEECVANKFAAHGIGQPQFAPPERAMYQIGG
ncbi:MAG: GTP 3',8-cyclase MoaA [Pirellulaceae bacterium]|nr:GTP 3',8-cyclase MoaA [Pirellulaceae bacterium]